MATYCTVDWFNVMWRRVVIQCVFMAVFRCLYVS